MINEVGNKKNVKTNGGKWYKDKPQTKQVLSIYTLLNRTTGEGEDQNVNKKKESESGRGRAPPPPTSRQPHMPGIDLYTI